jgi:hypothetical protein
VLIDAVKADIAERLIALSDDTEARVQAIRAEEQMVRECLEATLAQALAQIRADADLPGQVDFSDDGVYQPDELAALLGPIFRQKYDSRRQRELSERFGGVAPVEDPAA